MLLKYENAEEREKFLQNLTINRFDHRIHQIKCHYQSYQEFLDDIKGKMATCDTDQMKNILNIELFSENMIDHSIKLMKSSLKQMPDGSYGTLDEKFMIVLSLSAENFEKFGEKIYNLEAFCFLFESSEFAITDDISNTSDVLKEILPEYELMNYLLEFIDDSKMIRYKGNSKIPKENFKKFYSKNDEIFHNVFTQIYRQSVKKIENKLKILRNQLEYYERLDSLESDEKNKLKDASTLKEELESQFKDLTYKLSVGKRELEEKRKIFGEDLERYKIKESEIVEYLNEAKSDTDKFDISYKNLVDLYNDTQIEFLSIWKCFFNDFLGKTCDKINIAKKFASLKCLLILMMRQCLNDEESKKKINDYVEGNTRYEEIKHKISEFEFVMREIIDIESINREDVDKAREIDSLKAELKLLILVLIEQEESIEELNNDCIKLEQNLETIEANYSKIRATVEESNKALNNFKNYRNSIDSLSIDYNHTIKNYEELIKTLPFYTASIAILIAYRIPTDIAQLSSIIRHPNHQILDIMEWISSNAFDGGIGETHALQFSGTIYSGFSEARFLYFLLLHCAALEWIFSNGNHALIVDNIDLKSRLISDRKYPIKICHSLDENLPKSYRDYCTYLHQESLIIQDIDFRNQNGNYCQSLLEGERCKFSNPGSATKCIFHFKNRDMLDIHFKDSLLVENSETIRNILISNDIREISGDILDCCTGNNRKKDYKQFLDKLKQLRALDERILNCVDENMEIIIQNNFDYDCLRKLMAGRPIILTDVDQIKDLIANKEKDILEFEPILDLIVYKLKIIYQTIAAIDCKSQDDLDYHTEFKKIIELSIQSFAGNNFDLQKSEEIEYKYHYSLEKIDNFFQFLIKDVMVKFFTPNDASIIIHLLQNSLNATSKKSTPLHSTQTNYFDKSEDLKEFLQSEHFEFEGKQKEKLIDFFDKFSGKLTNLNFNNIFPIFSNALLSSKEFVQTNYDDRELMIAVCLAGGEFNLLKNLLPIERITNTSIGQSPLADNFQIDSSFAKINTLSSNSIFKLIFERIDLTADRIETIKNLKTRIEKFLIGNFNLENSEFQSIDVNLESDEVLENQIVSPRILVKIQECIEQRKQMIIFAHTTPTHLLGRLEKNILEFLLSKVTAQSSPNRRPSIFMVLSRIQCNKSSNASFGIQCERFRHLMILDEDSNNISCDSQLSASHFRSSQSNSKQQFIENYMESESQKAMILDLRNAECCGEILLTLNKKYKDCYLEIGSFAKLTAQQYSFSERMRGNRLEGGDIIECVALIDLKRHNLLLNEIIDREKQILGMEEEDSMIIVMWKSTNGSKKREDTLGSDGRIRHLIDANNSIILMNL
ncbi:MAG: hypothetical protein MHMPM18_001949 [Marteilia pararefringens]